MLSACEAPDSLEGTWNGTYDMTDAVLDMVFAEKNTEDFMEYMKLKDLTLNVKLEFHDGTIKMEADSSSVDALIVNVETAMYEMMDSMMRDMLLEMYQEMFSDVESLDDVAQLTDGLYENAQALLDDLAVNRGYRDYDTYIESSVKSVNMSEQIKESCKSMDIYGDYECDEDTGVLTIRYDDNTFEKMQYGFKGDKLVLNMSTDGSLIDIEYEKVSE